MIRESDRIDVSVMDSSELSEERLASEIRSRGRARLQRGDCIDLREYLDSVPGLRDRPLILDAAIDIALRSLSGKTHPTDATVDQLVAAHPDLERAIRTAAALSRALWSSEAMGATSGMPAREVPSPFGPPIDDGDPRYTLEELVGEGSSGAVYRAVDRSLSAGGRPVLVAVKVLHATRTDPVSRARFMEEASKARVLDHPCAVRVFDRGEAHGGEQYIVYELVDGGDLHAWAAARAGRAAKHDAARMIESVAEAIQAAHSAGLVHLDLKPANVLVSREGHPKVADFGLSMWGDPQRPDGAAGADRSVGTVAFMAPEQFRGDPGWASPRADVYALGGLLHWALTGSLPNGGTRAEIEQNLASTDDPKARLRADWRGMKPDGDLIAICARAMAPAKSDRYATAGELAADLCAWRERRPIRWMRPGAIRTMSLFAQRRPAMAGLVVLCAASLIGALVASERARAAADARAEAELTALREGERADEAQQWREDAKVGITEVYADLQKSREQGFGADVLFSLNFLDMLYGPSAMDDPAGLARSREERIVTVRALAESATALGGPTSMQALQARSLLGYLLVKQERLEEADAVLTENIAGWRTIVAPTDPWVRDLEILHLTVHAGLEVARLDGEKPVGDQRRALVEVERELRDYSDQLKKRADGSQLRRVVLLRLNQMYGPMCFDNAEWENWTVGCLKVLGVEVVKKSNATDADGRVEVVRAGDDGDEAQP